jgi:leader peptidase (prepilin peptidase) / N-methyltransferase
LFLSWPILAFLGIGFFMIGSVVGSFLNVCIYRIPWQKSVIWPSSRCPKCYSAIAARDNIPVVSWLVLRGECRKCGAPFSIRYPLIEALVGVLFLGAYLADVIAGPRGAWGEIPPVQLLAAAYHSLFLALLVFATFIDIDWWEIPDHITITGMAMGVGLGALCPQVRPVPADAVTHLHGFGVGILGLVAGAGLTFAFRQVFSFVFRREAMGLGDVTLMGMIGAFLGWQAAVLTYFIAPFMGIGHALWKLAKKFRKWWSGRELSSSDSELPYGPYLSLAAASLFLLWPWLYRVWARNFFGMLYVIFWWMLGIDAELPA